MFLLLQIHICNSVDSYGSELVEITYSAAVLCSAYHYKMASILQNTDSKLGVIWDVRFRSLSMLHHCNCHTACNMVFW